MASLGLGYYGSWLNVVDTITTDKTNFDLWTYINGIAFYRYGWTRATGKKLRAIITIGAGVNISSNNPLLPAMTIAADSATTFRTYDQVIIINNGNIYGASGIMGSGGGDTAGIDGGKGGTAIYTRRNILLTNNGKIYGGGGGGGGGGGSFYKWIENSSTNCPGSNYNGKCCITNCQGSNWCGGTAVCNPGIACNSYCEYHSNDESYNGSTIGTCNMRSRRCITYYGGNGGRGQGYNKNFATGVAGVVYSPTTIFTGSGGNGGDWGQSGLNGTSGSVTSFGLGGSAGCWIDGSELLNILDNNDERGFSCGSTGSTAQIVLWSGWSSTPSITTDPIDGSGVTLTTNGTNLQIEPRQSLTSIIVNNPTNLGGDMNLTNCSLLETLTCNTQNIATLNLSSCAKLKTINFNDNNLSNLNVAPCILLKDLYLDGNILGGNLSGLASLSTPNDEARNLYIKDNNMSAQNLTDIFNQLPIKTPTTESEWGIHIDDNPGVCTCDWTIAKNKDWKVYPSLYTLISNVNSTNEGTAVTFTLTSTIDSGNVPYTITGIDSADIGGASLIGNFVLYRGSAQATFNLTNDVLLEGVETMTLSIDAATCPTSKSVTINDTSTPFMADIVIASDVNNYNPSTYLTTNGWNGTKKVGLTITINAGVTVGSTSDTTAALTIPTLPAGSTVTVINNGNIYGAGGSGGNGTTSDGGNGSDGGTAISSGTPITLNNNGSIKGGGGGGGGGGGYSTSQAYTVLRKSADCCRPQNIGNWTTNNPVGQGCGTWDTDVCYGVSATNVNSCGIKVACVTEYTGTNYNGGNGGKGEGHGNVAANGTTGASGTTGGNGGAYGTDGTGGGNHNADNIGGNPGLAGYYLRLLSSATYVITSGPGAAVSGRVG